MRISLSVRHPPTVLEQLLGKRRARLVRKRLGYLALGAGVSLLKPRYRWRPVAVAASLLLLTLVAIR